MLSASACAVRTGLGAFSPTSCGRYSSAATVRSRSRSTESFCLGTANVSPKRQQRDSIRLLTSRRTLKRTAKTLGLTFPITLLGRADVKQTRRESKNQLCLGYQG